METNGLARNCLTTTCGAGFTCEWNSVYNGGQYICCSTGGSTGGTQQLLLCLHSYIASISGNRCPVNEVEQPSRLDCLAPRTCDTGYTCKYTSSSYYCCRSGTASNPTTTCKSDLFFNMYIYSREKCFFQLVARPPVLLNRPELQTVCSRIAPADTLARGHRKQALTVSTSAVRPLRPQAPPMQVSQHLSVRP